jgi:hypothetical protein
MAIAQAVAAGFLGHLDDFAYQSVTARPRADSPSIGSAALGLLTVTWDLCHAGERIGYAQRTLLEHREGWVSKESTSAASALAYASSSRTASGPDSALLAASAPSADVAGRLRSWNSKPVFAHR